MSAAKHTPGQWAIDWNISRLDIHSGGKLIATLRRSTKDVDDAEAAANARLIGAAPDLLEAAMAALAYNDAVRFPDGRGDFSWAPHLRAAIAAATGSAS